MSKLDTIKGTDVVQQYHSKKIDIFSKMMINSFGREPVKRMYFELINKKGKVVQILVTEQESIVQSAAHRMGLDYRIVEFEETFVDLDKNEESGEK